MDRWNMKSRKTILSNSIIMTFPSWIWKKWDISNFTGFIHLITLETEGFKEEKSGENWQSGKTDFSFSLSHSPCSVIRKLTSVVQVHRQLGADWNITSLRGSALIMSGRTILRRNFKSNFSFFPVIYPLIWYPQSSSEIKVVEEKDGR